MFQSVVIAGNLGADPELRYSANGKAVTNFRVAVQGRRDTAPEWFSVVCWEATAEAAAKFLSKGSKVLCAGRMQTRSWDDQQGKKQYRTELIAERVQFLTGGREGGDPDGLPSRDVSEDIDPDSLPF